ncbi:MAG: hypothetical protein AAF329_01005 [Cyanobacteria bacterium P01_A01_bin.17]
MAEYSYDTKRISAFSPTPAAKTNPLASRPFTALSYDSTVPAQSSQADLQAKGEQAHPMSRWRFDTAIAPKAPLPIESNAIPSVQAQTTEMAPSTGTPVQIPFVLPQVPAIPDYLNKSSRLPSIELQAKQVSALPMIHVPTITRRPGREIQRSVTLKHNSGTKQSNPLKIEDMYGFPQIVKDEKLRKAFREMIESTEPHEVLYDNEQGKVEMMKAVEAYIKKRPKDDGQSDDDKAESELQQLEHAYRTSVCYTVSKDQFVDDNLKNGLGGYTSKTMQSAIKYALEKTLPQRGENLSTHEAQILRGYLTPEALKRGDDPDSPDPSNPGTEDIEHAHEELYWDEKHGQGTGIKFLLDQANQRRQQGIYEAEKARRETPEWKAEVARAREAREAEIAFTGGSPYSVPEMPTVIPETIRTDPALTRIDPVAHASLQEQASESKANYTKSTVAQDTRKDDGRRGHRLFINLQNMHEHLYGKRLEEGNIISKVVANPECFDHDEDLLNYCLSEWSKCM